MEKLQLYYAVKPYQINQSFGQNGSDFYKAQGMIGHNGIDFLAKHGQAIYASHDGYCYPEIDAAGGNGVVIFSKQQYDYNGTPTWFKTIYWHMIKDNAVVHTGQEVKAGDLIGYANSTGNSTGDHLHFGLKPVAKDEDAGAWYNVAQNNGYFGAIDPLPFFNGKFAEDLYFTPSKKILKLGDWNADVKNLQIILNKKGTTPVLTPDGHFGAKTLQAVKDFQIVHKLGVDGLVGPKTWKELLK